MNLRELALLMHLSIMPIVHRVIAFTWVDLSHSKVVKRYK